MGEEVGREELDFRKEENGLKLGGGLYDMGEGGGLRRSKGERLKEEEKDINENGGEEIRIECDLLKKWEEKK